MCIRKTNTQQELIISLINLGCAEVQIFYGQMLMFDSHSVFHRQHGFLLPICIFAILDVQMVPDIPFVLWKTDHCTILLAQSTVFGSLFN